MNVYDLMLDVAGNIIFVNTDFSCLATIGNDYSFVPLCQPPFISKLLAEDDCHLNGYRNSPLQTAPAPAVTMLGFSRTVRLVAAIANRTSIHHLPNQSAFSFRQHTREVDR
ncbi:DUF4915 domain-containing protein [Nostoc sp.]|uniref:DUF4915 domain-containing protein n=1 Tax=Nostoc sp. TaxID=1180 RepID=UPI002FF51DD7